MRLSSLAWRIGVLASIVVGSLALERARGAEATTGTVRPAPIGSASSTTANKLVVPNPAARPKRHPLTPVLKYARAEQGYLERNVRSFSCRLVKRERIEDELQEHHFIDLQVQEQKRGVDGGLRPMRVYLMFLAPSEVKGRKVLFIEGENKGKMLVRKGGTRFSYAVVKIDPLGEGAQRESLVPITELGFSRLLGRQIAILETHLKVDPTGENTRVQHYNDTKINDRSCELICITHAKPQAGLEFHVANVYIDNLLHVPVRIDYSGWPETEGESPPLIAEYTYTDLRLNVDFPESTFDAARLNK